MKQKMMMRYYCDFCKKSGCSSYHMRRHEESCTANPGRKCRMCETAQGMPELVEATRKCTEGDIGPLREAAEGCPACMLAGIRQSGMQRPPSGMLKDFDPGFHFYAFEFKKEKDEWWKSVNDEHGSMAGY